MPSPTLQPYLKPGYRPGHRPNHRINRQATLLLLGLLLAAQFVLAGCARSDFSTPADLSAIEQALGKAGLNVCSTADLTWAAAPGFVSGKHFVLALDCATADPNFPGVSLTAARFDSLADRDAAQRSFETSHRRPIGLGNAWTLGPYLLTVDGSQQQAALQQLQLAMQSLGAQ